MQILLKDLLKEAEAAKAAKVNPVAPANPEKPDNASDDTTTATTTDSPLKVQVYCDMDGVLANLDKGFKAISGGYSPENFKDKFGGDKKAAQKKFWELIARTPNFWLNLEPMPDAHVLWKYLTNNFTDPAPVILTAGQGPNIKQQKTDWAHKHFGPDVQVIVASSGVKKPEYIINQPLQNGQYVTHVLIDDTQKNINAWDNEPQHRIAIHHKNSADSIKSLQPFITK